MLSVGKNKFPRKLSNNWTHRDTLKLVIVVEEVCILLTSYIFRKSCPHVSNFYYCYWQFKWKSILRDNRVQLRHVRILRQQTIAPKQNNTKSVECPSKGSHQLWKKRFFVKPLHKMVTPSPIPLLCSPYLFFFRPFFDRKKRWFWRLFEGCWWVF